jgi:hypothetical protein
MVESQPDGEAIIVFAPYCPTHHSRVLLFAENIDGIDNRDGCPTIHFHCTCGFVGTWRPDREAA